MAKAAKAEFTSILDRPSSDIEKPKPLPQGTYRFTVQGLPKYDKSTKKQTSYVEFALKPTAAMDDVDEDDLKAMGGFANKTVKATYYETEDAIWRLKEFLDHCGAGEENETLRVRNEQTPNCEVMGTIKHEFSQDGTAVFAKLGTTAPVE